MKNEQIRVTITPVERALVPTRDVVPCGSRLLIRSEPGLPPECPIHGPQSVCALVEAPTEAEARRRGEAAFREEHARRPAREGADEEKWARVERVEPVAIPSVVELA